jgi:PAT family acetyl-CoA transporter-like MFS transporter 1
VDAWFVHKWGRRKSWIVPVQGIVGMGLWLIGGRIESWLDAVSWSYPFAYLAYAQEHVDIKFITMVFGGLIMAAATQGELVRGPSCAKADSQILLLMVSH